MEKRGYEQMLLPTFETPLEVDPTFCFTFDAANYPAHRFYEGPARFRKHYYLQPAYMNSEEADCAAFIDTHAQVDYWVRNLERSDHAFWLPTSTDRFYPDFVVSLKDERILVVEYKGAIWRELPDSDEEERIGKLWASRSKGRCMFLLVGKSDYQAQIHTAIAGE